MPPATLQHEPFLPSVHDYCAGATLDSADSTAVGAAAL